MNVHHLVVGLLQANCFLLHDEGTNEAFLIDPGDEAARILDLIARAGAQVIGIPNTHAHFDHVLAAPEVIAATRAPFWLHKEDEPVLGIAADTAAMWIGRAWGPPPAIAGYLAAGDHLHLGATELEVRHVPGHSPGSVIFIDHAGRRAWVGDTVFAGSIGRTDFPGCSYEQLIDAIHSQILTLPDAYTLYPGHGPATSVGRERRSNPFLS